MYPPVEPHKYNYSIILSENSCQFFMGSAESYILSENCTAFYRGRELVGRGMWKLQVTVKLHRRDL